MTTGQDVFQALRQLMLPYASKLDCVKDCDDQLYVNTRMKDKKGKPIFFGAVQQKKSYISFHLMPIYQDPTLLKGASPALMKHMQGKSCFNFKTLDKDLLAELRSLTDKCFRAHKNAETS